MDKAYLKYYRKEFKKLSPEKLKKKIRKQRKFHNLAWHGACRLAAYISYKAERENVGCKLTPLFFFDTWQSGACEFFGIKVDDCLEIIEDTRDPDWYSDYCRREIIVKNHFKKFPEDRKTIPMKMFIDHEYPTLH